MSEVYKSEEDLEQRRNDIKNKGLWVCAECGTKYFLGHNCDLCMSKELQKEILKNK